MSNLLKEAQNALDFLNSLLEAKPTEAIDFLTNNGEDVAEGLQQAINLEKLNHEQR
jgi:hypothetical protein